MKTWMIIQARATSTRLPGKIFKEVCGVSLLEHQISRLRRVRLCESILIATTRNLADDRTVALAQKCGVAFYRGDEHDVLSRYFEAALYCGAEAIVRITSDCPLIDAAIVNHVIERFHGEKADYASNTLKRTYPRGLDTEVFSLRALREAFYEAQSESDREHVTPFIRNQPERFRCMSIEGNADLSTHRWTVDTAEDFLLIEKIFSAAPQEYFDLDQTLTILRAHPEWIKINAHIEQKKSD